MAMHKSYTILFALLLSTYIPVIVADDSATTNNKQHAQSDMHKKNIYNNLQQDLIAQCNRVEIATEELSKKTIPHVTSHPLREQISNALIATRETIHEVKKTLERPCAAADIVYALESLHTICDELVARTKNNTRLKQLHMRYNAELIDDIDTQTFEYIVHLYQMLEQKITALSKIVISYDYSSLMAFWHNTVSATNALHLKTIITRSPKYIALFAYWIAIKPKSDFAGYREPKKLTWLQELQGETVQREQKNCLTLLKDLIGGIEKKEIKDTRYEKKNVYYGIFKPARTTEGLIDFDTKASLFKICVPTLILPAIKKDITDLYAWLTAVKPVDNSVRKARNITPLDDNACKAYLETICLINSIPTTAHDIDLCAELCSGKTVFQLEQLFEEIKEQCIAHDKPLCMDTILKAITK
jgi:hypothetical protein